MKIYELFHWYQIEDNDDADDVFRIIGVFSTEIKAREAIPKFQKMKAFQKRPDAFYIKEHEVDCCNMPDGFDTYLKRVNRKWNVVDE